MFELYFSFIRWNVSLFGASGVPLAFMEIAITLLFVCFASEKVKNKV